MKRDRRTRPADGRERLLPPEEAFPERFLWIVDGHNAIFALADLETLQTEGHKREARRALEERLEAFGRAIGRQMVIVYDGNRMERNPDAVTFPHLRTEYSLAPEEADDRIRYLVQRALEAGIPPMVVTSDRRTLAAALPPGARHVSVEDFFRRVARSRIHRPEKWKPEGMEDLERYFLSRSPYEEDRREAGSESEPSSGPPSDPSADPPSGPPAAPTTGKPAEPQK